MMDRGSWLGVIGCFILMIVWMQYSQTRWPAPKHPPKSAATSTATVSEATTNPTAINPPTPQTDKMPEEVTAVLENEDVRAVFTNHGGAIKEIELKKHKQTGTENIKLNRNTTEPVLNLSGWEGDHSIFVYDVQPLDKKISFRHKLTNGAVLERTYHLEDNYRILLEQTVTNPGAQPVAMPAWKMNVGTSSPIHRFDNPTYTASSWMLLPDHRYTKNTPVNFQASTVPLIGYKLRDERSVISSTDKPLGWSSVQNQFFAMILTPPTDCLINEVALTKGEVTDADTKSAPLLQTIHAEASFDGYTLAPAQTRVENFQLYAGPKEYARLHTLGRHEDLVMDFGWSGWLIKPLLSVMRGIHSYIPSWGLTIIAITLIIRLFMWPLQSAQNKSMKQMQALQPKMATLREKYKDNPTKFNEEQMKMFREYGVNPLGGCLPMVFQLPIFIAFYSMLQSVVELRGSSFLWIHDLTQPDTLFQFALAGQHINVNLLPLIMTATSVVMMRMTPQTAETQQMKFMQFLPLVFLFILYNFAAALSLYMTVGNFVSIIQNYRNLRKPLPKMDRVPKSKQLSFGRS